MHVKCVTLLETKKDEQMPNSMKVAQSHFMERNQENIDATTKIFRTAYECAKSHLSFREHSRLVELQHLNGVERGNVLDSPHACSNYIYIL